MLALELFLFDIFFTSHQDPMEQERHQEEVRSERIQRIYEFQRNNGEFYENSYTNCRFPYEPDLLTHQEVRQQEQKKNEEIFCTLCKEAEDGEIIDLFIELADFRLMRCIFAHHFSPKERVIEIPIASDEYMRFFNL